MSTQEESLKNNKPIYDTTFNLKRVNSKTNRGQ